MQAGLYRTLERVCWKVFSSQPWMTGGRVCVLSMWPTGGMCRTKRDRSTATVARMTTHENGLSVVADAVKVCLVLLTVIV